MREPRRGDGAYDRHRAGVLDGDGSAHDTITPR